MDLTVAIPDELARRLQGDSDLARRALEAFAAEEYRAGRLTAAELRRWLGYGLQASLDDFLKARGIDTSEQGTPGGRGSSAKSDAIEREQPDLAEAIRKRFAPVGGVDDLMIPPREQAREPPRFVR